MSKEDEIIHVEMNEKDVQDLVNCYEKDIKYIEQLEQELDKYKNIVDELRWKPIEEYEKPKYDWVLVKYFIEPNFECIPCVAENRFGKWYDRNNNLINGEVRYFADMELLDALEELKGE